MIARSSLVPFALLVLAAPAGAAWPPEGLPLCAELCGGDFPLICPDGAGGAYVTWRDARNANDDVYLQRVTGAGTFPTGWPSVGIPVCVQPRYQAAESIVPDGQGGVLVAWVDQRTLGSGQDIYAQRITASGEIGPGWPLNGAPVSRAGDYQDLPVLAPDGAGGAFVAWQDNRRGVDTMDVYAQHLTLVGDVASGWPTDGMAVCTASHFSGHPAIVPDDSGGALITWSDLRRGVVDLYAQHITASGDIAPGWVVNGLPVMLGRGDSRVVADHAGGALIAGSTKNSFGDDLEYYVQRFTFAGTVAPGWPAGGVRVCAAPEIRETLRAAPDARGGILLTWYDYRDPHSGGDIYALRVRPDGNLAPGWTVNGTRVTNIPDYEYAADIAPDGLGGAYVCWRRENSFGYRTPVQHLTASGAVAPGWVPNGIGVGTSYGQFDPRIASDGAGGAIMTWEQYLRGPYAQRFVPDGIVPVLLSPVSAEAEPDRVRLVWHTADALALHATVERRGERSEWQALAAVSADGTGRIEYEDRGVTVGARYGYRLAYSEDGADRRTAETWVEVPQALELALAGLRPNPAVGELNVWFTLPSAERATLDLLDVTGRRVISLEVGALGAGHHVVRLDQGTPVAPGLYWVALRGTGQTLRARATVIR